MNRPAAAAAAALLLLATACNGNTAGAASEPSAAEQTPSSAPPAADSPLDREDKTGQVVCDRALEKLTILGAVDDEWDQDQWFAWWDDAYDLAELAVLARTSEIQDQGRTLRDAEPPELAGEMVMMALTCVEQDFLTEEQFQDHVADVIDLDQDR